SEGTLGIITAAVLKLFPRPAERATAFVALDDIDRALDLFSLAQEHAGASLTAFEFLQRIVVEFVLRHISSTRDPFSQSYPWYVLLETSGLKPDGTAQEVMQALLQDASERGIIIDATIASSLAQARDFWRLREAVSEAQKPEGGVIKHDISVPVARIPEFIGR